MLPMTEILTNIRKGQAGIGLSAGDLETITAHNIFRPSRTSRTKHHRKRCDHPRKRGKRAGIRAKLTQVGPKATPLLHYPDCSWLMSGHRKIKWMK